MGAGFIRRYPSDPGLAAILGIEGVVIIDREAPAVITGGAAFPVCVVGEFEDGPYAEPVELFSGDDQVATFGAFGFAHDGLVSSNPCARSRLVDATLTPEYWNGNGFVALASKRFSRLFVVRVDTSVGAVEFTRRAALLGNGNFNWAFPASGLTAVFRKSVSDTDTATFTGVVAALVSAAGTYPTTFAGGESMNVTVDANTPNQIGPIDIPFASTDTTQALVIARINAVLGYTAAVSTSGTVITASGRVPGNTGMFRVNSVSTGLVTTATGFSAAAAIGTGNVGNLNAVTFGEVKAIIEAAVDVVAVDRDLNGRLRVKATTGVELAYQASSTADVLGFTESQGSDADTGYAFMYSGAGTYPTTFSGGETLTLGVDGEANVTVVFLDADESQAQCISRINTYMGFTCAVSASGTVIRFTGRANGGEVRIVAASATVVTKLAVTVGLTQTAVPCVATIIPAGTRVRNSSAVTWLTTQSTAVAVDDQGPYSIRVRPALDDGTVGAGTAAAVTVLVDPIDGAAFTVVNPLGLSAALTEAALDAAYVTAIDSTKSTGSPAKDTNAIVSARQSNAIRTRLRTNAVDASFGLKGRVAVVRPPLGTTRAQARSTSSQPGVGATRSENVTYAFPGAHMYVQQIAARGTSGGAGFTADGFIDVGADVWAASLMSLLPPEQNIGQETAYMSEVVGVEANNADVQGMEMADYIAFKAAGILALRVADGTAIFQSDVTSVDPATSPNKAPGNRRRFAYYAQDALAARANAFSKKPMTRSNRSSVLGEFKGFCEQLLSPNDPDAARIFAYSLDAKSGNPQAALDAGVFRIKTRIKMNPDMLDIVIDSEIGPTVVVAITG